MTWTENVASPGSELARARRLATTDAAAAAHAALERALAAGQAFEARIAAEQTLAEAVLAADAMLADLDAQGGPSRTVELAVWDEIVRLARMVLE